MLKTCTRCHESKPLDAFPHGRGARCRVCRNAVALARRNSNLEAARERTRAWRAAHPTAGALGAKAYRAANREKVLASGRRYHEANKARRKAEARIRANQRYHANIDALRIAGRLYYHANRERILAQRRAAHAANPEKNRMNHAIRRARKQAAPVVERVVLSVVYRRDQGVCSLCHTHVPRKEASIDHIIPLTKGGEHSYRNVALAHFRCNSSKHNNVATQQMRLF